MQASSPSNIHARLLSTDDLIKLIRRSLADGLTGQIQVTFLKEKTLTLFTHGGKVRQMYIRNHRAPDMNWEFPLDEYGRGDLKIESIPPRGLMFRKIVLEGSEKVKPQPVKTKDLKFMLETADQNHTNPTLFHIIWDSAEGMALMAGRDIPLHRAVMLTKDGVQEGSFALDQMCTWNEAGCQVTVHRGNTQSQAWFEVHLNILLEHYCSMLLDKYGQLTGKVMVRSILWQIHNMAVKEGWNVDPPENDIRDATIFPTARDAGDAYKKIITEIIARAEHVVGLPLMQNILMQSFRSTKGVYRTIAEVFNLLGVSSS